MGNWAIYIEGVGCHGNNNPLLDADITAKRLLADLRSQGHHVQVATFTHGGADNLMHMPHDVRDVRNVPVCLATLEALALNLCYAVEAMPASERNTALGVQASSLYQAVRTAQQKSIGQHPELPLQAEAAAEATAAQAERI